VSKQNGRTEKPTARRRKEARREGNLPRSQETNSMIAISVALITLAATAPSALAVTLGVMRKWLSNADPIIGLRKADLVDSVTKLVAAWCPPVLAAAAAGIVATLAQGGLVMLPKTARPTLKHLSWKRGLSQLNPKQAGYTLLRNVLKFVIVGTALITPVVALRDNVPTASGLGEAAGLTGRTLSSVTSRVIAGALLIAALDQVVTRRRWRNGLLMSRQQIIDENRLQEGDPHAKAQRKRRGMELRRRRALGDISTADVVITNPIHFAVALAYAENSSAPRVVCKGTERMARAIRRNASRHGVPIIENRPLARALYRQVPLGGYVPERFFDDVVKVLVAAYWRRGRVPGHVANRPAMVSSRHRMTGARV
jgi:flagellar biosynthetic protein FlhB